jgi:hypothetical protein
MSIRHKEEQMSKRFHRLLVTAVALTALAAVPASAQAGIKRAYTCGFTSNTYLYDVDPDPIKAGAINGVFESDTGYLPTECAGVPAMVGTYGYSSRGTFTGQGANVRDAGWGGCTVPAAATLEGTDSWIWLAGESLDVDLTWTMAGDKVTVTGNGWSDSGKFVTVTGGGSSSFAMCGDLLWHGAMVVEISN